MNRLTLVVLGVFALVVMSSSVYSQDKPIPNHQDHYSLNPNGGVNGVVPSMTPAPKQELSAEKKDLLRQLKEARRSGNSQRVQEIWDQLSRLNGSRSVTGNENSNLPVPENIFNHRIEAPFETDYVVSPVNTGTFIWSIATDNNPAGAPNAGRIWCAYSAYGVSSTDTCRIYYSDNQGATWTLYASFNYGSSAVHFRSHELDLETVYDGAAVWLFITASVSFTGFPAYSFMARYNTTTNAFYYVNLNFLPGPGPNILQYNAKVTSDESVWGSSAFVYLFCGIDSLYGGTNHYLRQKSIVIANPFVATPTLTYSVGLLWPWFYAGQPANVYQYLDMDYSDSSGTDRLFSIVQFGFGNAGNVRNIYCAWSDDYFASIEGQMILSETNVAYRASLAFNGGSNIRTGMIVYERQFSGTDWDAYYRYTATSGGSIGAWTGGYVDAAGSRERQPDIQALRSLASDFKVSYIKDSSGQKVMSTGTTNGTLFNAPSTLAVSPNLLPDTVFQWPVAGYRNGGGDDCLTFWSTNGGRGVYASRLCQTTVGIGSNNEIPTVYSLSQNYPNPFNPSTVIDYAIPVGGQVKLTVYNLIGEEVAVLVNDFKSAGTYSIEFNGSSLASGVYFYKLESGDFSDIKKLVLLK